MVVVFRIILFLIVRLVVMQFLLESVAVQLLAGIPRFAGAVFAIILSLSIAQLVIALSIAQAVTALDMVAIMKVRHFQAEAADSSIARETVVVQWPRWCLCTKLNPPYCT